MSNDDEQDPVQKNTHPAPEKEQEFHIYKLLGALGIVIGMLALIAFVLNVYFLGWD